LENLCNTMEQAAAPAPNPALWLAARWGRTEEVRQRLLGGANIDERVGVKIQSTPLQVAVQMGHTDVVQVLLEHGADVSAAFNGNTPLHLAANYAHAELVKLLFQHGADVSATDANGCTPLHKAAKQGHAESVKVLLQHGADVSATSNRGLMALHEAAYHGHAEVAKVLLENGADVLATSMQGMMALHWAAGTGQVEVVRVLIEHRANILAEDNEGRTAQFWATVGMKPGGKKSQVVAILQVAAVTRAKCVAFAMGHHKRLGVGSLVAPLDAEVVRMLLDLVL
jgi:ankyrin repeat protein